MSLSPWRLQAVASDEDQRLADREVAIGYSKAGVQLNVRLCGMA
jgi:hypothetical protein